ncbi:DUF6879 family protein [Streptomyces yaizuensis]|uniref:DUF6879 domain-containing protein n=1 Tax=Streptomyces yaizuensis TaxID=2989713 RepID=A0ABQ5P4T2_9ACTN|nr:DUF6879 family protein [Streptomyces sp. YSPA8]GLF97607.1 hypothetical protein SYYSPA8_24940 [Streptomyces sp. YSPA8]
MAPRLRVIGTTSGEGKCPTLYDNLDTGEVVVQGRTVTNPTGAVDVLKGESFVAVPRELLIRFAPADERSGPPVYIDDDTFGDYFETFKHTAWRLETRRGYASDQATEKYAAWLESGQVPDDTGRPWHTNVRKQVDQGKRFERVRLVDNPPTPEQRYLFATADSNCRAGEDIRNLWRMDAERLQLPGEDFYFWLFDSRRALVLHFDDDDEYLGAELVEDPAVIIRFCQIRDTAWHHALKRADFARQL